MYRAGSSKLPVILLLPAIEYKYSVLIVPYCMYLSMVHVFKHGQKRTRHHDFAHLSLCCFITRPVLLLLLHVQ